MDYSFDGHGLSREQLRAKAEAAELTGQLDGDASHRQPAHPRTPKPDDACDWQGDAPEPELDDLAQACEKNQQPSLHADVCDWRGDEPERHEDDLGQIFQSDNRQAQQSGRVDTPVKQDDAIQMPIPRLPQVAEIPEILLPSTDDQSLSQNHDTKPPVEPPARDGKQSGHGKKPKKKKAHAANTAGPSKTPPRENGGEDESPTGDQTHSPWVDSLDQMPTSVIEKVNLGIKHSLEAARSILTPPAREQSQSPGSAAGEKTRGTTSLAPVSAAPPPSDFFVPSPSRHSTEPPTEIGVYDGNQKKERERKRSERKARHEAKRKARQEKNQERKEKRRETKERNRKEKQWQKAAKKGGELPAHLLQGLRIAPDSKVSYHPNCDICKTSTASVVSSKKRDPKCPTCTKAAERESTNQYLKSSKINLTDLPSLDELLDIVRHLTGQDSKDKKPKEEVSASDQGRADEELVQHISQHIRDLVTHGGEADLSGHKCNAKDQPGHSGRHGYDGHDSPVSTDGGQMISSSSQNSDLSTIPTPPEVDWWVQAISSNESAPSPYRPLSPRTVTPLPR
ncbi:hypothetical protein F4824DRAFT_499707 [Ustulina deusta]|nr:hypothetical protein F4824DRAFT_499707 [Ustulina deusta]